MMIVPSPFGEQLDPAEQTRNCTKLLSAVVATAVRDACATPITRRGKTIGTLPPDTYTALRFLFSGTVTGVGAYADWLDFDVANFRQQLIRFMHDVTPETKQGITSIQRRAFRVNWRIYKTMGDDHAAGRENETDQ